MLIRALQLPTEHPLSKRVNTKLVLVLKLLDSRLRQAKWLAGGEFTPADIMSVFSLTTMRTFMPFDLSECPNILEYLKRVGGREAYRDAMAKGDPGLEPILEGPALELFPGTKS